MQHITDRDDLVGGGTIPSGSFVSATVTGPPSREENRVSTLERAKQAVMNDRNNDYGDPEDNFQHIAHMWNAYLSTDEDDLLPTDVAAMMIIVKLARITTSPQNQDHWVDAAGYAACGYGCAAEAELD